MSRYPTLQQHKFQMTPMEIGGQEDNAGIDGAAPGHTATESILFRASLPSHSVAILSAPYPHIPTGVAEDVRLFVPKSSTADVVEWTLNSLENRRSTDSSAVPLSRRFCLVVRLQCY